LVSTAVSEAYFVALIESHGGRCYFVELSGTGRESAARLVGQLLRVCVSLG
jgi:hypothetical protein